MRLFHVSEEGNIDKFVPRIPYRQDMDKSKGLVWSLTEPSLPTWLTPRDCPRIGYRVKEDTTAEDIERFFSSDSHHCVAIEHGWHARMLSTTIYLYEFDPGNFYFDATAGFYVSDQTEYPISLTVYSDLYAVIMNRNAEIRLVSNLWQLGDAVQKSTLKWSLCRMKNAKPRDGQNEAV